MEIDHKADWAWQRITRFLDLARAEDIDAISASLRTAGPKGFFSFYEHHDVAIVRMMSSAPGQAEATLAAMPKKLRHLMLIAVLYRLRRALCILKALSDRAADPLAELEDWDLTNRMAEAAELVAKQYPTIWPFDELDPFDEIEHGPDKDGTPP